MEVKFKRLNDDARLPTRANNLDAGFDLYAAERPEQYRDVITYKLGLAVAIPAGYVGLIFPRSSIYKFDLAMANSVGVIDAGYRGEVMVKFRETDYEHDEWTSHSWYSYGDRIAQLIIMPLVAWAPVWAEGELPEAGDTRGTGGYGSSGK